MSPTRFIMMLLVYLTMFIRPSRHVAALFISSCCRMSVKPGILGGAAYNRLLIFSSIYQSATPENARRISYGRRLRGSAFAIIAFLYFRRAALLAWRVRPVSAIISALNVLVDDDLLYLRFSMRRRHRSAGLIFRCVTLRLCIVAIWLGVFSGKNDVLASEIPGNDNRIIIDISSYFCLRIVISPKAYTNVIYPEADHLCQA